MVRSGVVATESDSVSTTADGLAAPSNLGVGTSLHVIEDGFLDSRNIVLGQVLLPAMLGRSRLTIDGVLFFFPDLGTISIISVVDLSGSIGGVACSHFVSHCTAHMLFKLVPLSMAPRR